jgi:hypothetical protein
VEREQIIIKRSPAVPPTPATPEVRWADEVDDDIAPLLGESYQDWRRGKRRRAICALMNSERLDHTELGAEVCRSCTLVWQTAQGERGLEGRNRGAASPVLHEVVFLLSRHHSQHSTTTPPIHPSRLLPPLFSALPSSSPGPLKPACDIHHYTSS